VQIRHIYETVDLLERGKFFLKCVVKQWPVPLSLRAVGAIVLMATDASADDLSVQVAPHAQPEPDGWIVQVRDPQRRRAYLTVSLAGDGGYLSGSHCGFPVDELGAVNALALYAPFIEGEWRVMDSTISGASPQTNGDSG
jgi:hypothetical protein